MKAMIFHGIFSVKSITFVPFHSIAMYYWNFMISYRDKQNFSVCYHTILPLGDIGKYFAIVKRKVISPISQILNCCFLHFSKYYCSPLQCFPLQSLLLELCKVRSSIGRCLLLTLWIPNSSFPRYSVRTSEGTMGAVCGTPVGGDNFTSLFTKLWCRSAFNLSWSS